ncbi:MAG: flagellar assembly protein FlbE [Brevundimonas sp.]|uniref:flagellar assembly protein FlbE n=1 Tax=Brevundimonas sp. TaxID=1871086 RepID=UPI002721F527|nr:flagellar assembly protein FlbE [Brevundimonas sp.]MDO9586354.1 flagellar assembly protein FlbE [Brevundimonas sp.]MDP3368371.1 flagellar assembly protein FlbE [Brevundimonas sp.]MDZ4108013.1 flagellar assembly protein FlbE [Brevundimonas sp.]
MTHQPLSTPFAFDTEFDALGVVVQASAFRPAKRSYAPLEVEALIAQARLEGRTEALAESESLQAMALSVIGQALDAAIPALTQVARAHREQSAELALAAARVIAASALDRYPAAPLQAALESLAQEIDASPRLVVRAGDLGDAARARIEQLCADAGFSGVVAFREGPGLAAAAFQLEWADGRAAFDPDEAFARMGEVLKSALAAEAGHAEALTPETSLEGRP